MDAQRPDPDELLARARRAETQRHRGRLKVYFGMAPGVGKTYAMLESAQRFARSGVDVVVGVVETHGRSETEQLLLGLDLLPPREVEYRGVTLREFDLDGALRRRPEVIVVDELAHDNAPGSLHAKRWHDVEALRDAGIDVLSTLNVQHIESLNDVVARITGVQVRETVPDAVLEGSDEIELVDLPPDALLERLKAGKVYLPENAERAMESFFRKSNLTALRELALRRTAELVDTQMREEQRDAGVRAVWPARDRIVVCVGPSPRSATLLRSARRMAAGLHAELIAVHVDDPGRRLKASDRERVLEHLRLAESLGAEAATIAPAQTRGDLAAEVVAFARSRNANRIVVGRTAVARWRELLRPSFMTALIRRAGDIEVTVLSDAGESDAARGTSGGIAQRSGEDVGHSAKRFAAAAAVIAMATVTALLVRSPPDLSDEAMIFVAAVAIAGWRFGRWPSLFAAALAMLAFNFFFTEPRHSLRVQDPANLITMAVILVVGMSIATLTARTREQADAARERERWTSALYSAARSLATARDRDDVAAIAARQATELLGADAIVLAPREGDDHVALDVLAISGSPDWFDEHERAVARRAFDHGDPTGAGTSVLPLAAGRSTPLITGNGKKGVLVVRFESTPAPAQLFLLDTMAALLAAALDRADLTEARHVARIEAETERLRSTLLSTVSHDLRTPLASIEGSASALLEAGDALDRKSQRELLEGLVEESRRLGRLVSNLLFATRLDAGGITPKREWTTVEELVGTGLAPHREALASRDFRCVIASGLPFLRVDGAMIPQVIANLIENALRYAPAKTRIELQAWADENNVVTRISDEGPGLAPGETERVFRRFWRGRAAKSAESSSAGSGLGLGLSIAEGIVRAHGGRIWAEPNVLQGVAFSFSLPIEQPQPGVPSIEPELTEEAAS